MSSITEGTSGLNIGACLESVSYDQDSCDEGTNEKYLKKPSCRDVILAKEIVGDKQEG